jgi:fumarate reductase flavoprotein subunit
MPIVKAPFHALPVAAGITYTMGGISIDEHARALDAGGNPLGRLYAAGCCTGGLEGGPDSGGYVGGLAKSGVTALRAAEHIAAHIK